jgi:hypothetical protein
MHVIVKITQSKTTAAVKCSKKDGSLSRRYLTSTKTDGAGRLPLQNFPAR